MPVKVLGLVGAETMLLNVDTTAKKRVRRSLVTHAHKIRDLAADMAPRDEGALEKSIKVQGDTLERTRDDLGRFTHTEVEVYIDFDMPHPERSGKTVGDYAYYIHEGLQPRGSWEPGDESKKKEKQVGVQVGGGFLDRAAIALDKSLDAELVEIVRNDFL
jgi:hypothetical protein